MFNVVYYEPEIPSNTGATIRLCANAGSRLHLIEPISFDMDDKKLKRAGLDYHEYVTVKIWPSFSAYRIENPQGMVYACSTHASHHYSECQFNLGDTLLFGPETRGLPADLLQEIEGLERIRIPMSGNGRSLNLANATSVILYEAWRQSGFKGGN